MEIDNSANEINESLINMYKDSFFISEDMKSSEQLYRNYNEKGLVVIHLNIRSIRKNWEEFYIQMKEYTEKFDIIILTEIAIFEHENMLYNIEGYTGIFYNRKLMKGGGIAVFLKDNLQGSIVKIEQNMYSKHEIIHFKLNIKGKIIHILAVYRPPDTNKAEFIRQIELELVKINDKENVVLIGDINIDISKENNVYVNSYCDILANEESDIYVNMYCNMLANQGLHNCIFSYTREEIKQGIVYRSLIDHAYVRIGGLLKSSVIKLQMSDHYAIAFNMSIEPGNENNVIIENKYNCVRYNEKKLQRMLLEFSWDHYIDKLNNKCNKIGLGNSSEIYDSICNNFIKLYNSTRQIESVTGKRKINKCWITQDLIDKIKIRDRAYKDWKNTPTNNIYRDKYKNLRNKINKEIKVQKNQFHIKRI